ncbi:MAG: diguanylate cyclase [Pseudomonadota bacterium]
MNEQSRTPNQLFSLSGAALDQLLPMHLIFDATGMVLRAGTTFTKIFGETALIGRSVFDLVALRRPSIEPSIGNLLALEGQRLNLNLTTRQNLTLRGQCIALPQGAGGILNISLGLSFAEAVETCGLTLSDFSHCDQTVELVYLREAIEAVSLESRRLTDRLVAAEKAAEARATSDALTGLTNRRGLEAELDRLVWQVDQPFALMQLDLDHFKSINDELGHAVGDGVLQRVAKVLRGAVRKKDVVARMGGDEFVVAVRGTDERSLLDKIARRILDGLAHPADIDGHKLSIGASIGITRSSLYATPDIEQMLKNADEALYASKRDGRGRHCIYKPPGMSERIGP